MTIFGFNTDVRLGDLVYHVQSEARQADLLLQTLVFVKGQCMGKRASSYAQKVFDPRFSEEATHELLKAQHKAVLDALQQGRTELVLVSNSDIQDVGEGGLTLKWTNPAQRCEGSLLLMSFQVLAAGAVVPGAGIEVVDTSSGTSPAVASGITDSAGNAILNVHLTGQMSQECAVIVRATHAGKSATRKFRFKK
jgi:hypothetical protein